MDPKKAIPQIEAEESTKHIAGYDALAARLKKMEGGGQVDAAEVSVMIAAIADAKNWRGIRHR